MSKKNLGLLAAAIGVLIALVSALADQLGLGETSGFGPSQILGTIIGVLMLVVGLTILLGAKRPG